MAATVGELSELHTLVAQTLADEIRREPSAALLNVARSFLRDSRITTDPARPGKAVEGLVDALDDPHYVPDMPTTFPQ